MDEEELKNLADADIHEKMAEMMGDRSPTHYRMQQELDRRLLERVTGEYMRWTKFAAIAAVVAAAFAVLTLVITLLTRDW